MRRATLFAALLLTPALGLAAQAPLHLHVGHRVRITTDSGSQWLVGALVAADEDSLQLRTADNAPVVSVARRTVSRFEVSRGRLSNVARCAATMAAVGAGAGLALGLLVASQDAHSWVHVGPGDVAQIAAITGAVGAGIGALAGLGQTERWKAVRLGRGHVALAPRGPGLALSLTF